MLPQDDIDAVLREAQNAVDDLSSDMGPISDGAAPAPSPSTATAAPPTRPVTARVERILKLRVPMIVRLAQRQMRLETIMKMGPGTILEFNRTVHDDLDLMINNCRIGTGVAVKVHERFGLRITKIDDVKHRIDSLGAS